MLAALQPALVFRSIAESWGLGFLIVGYVGISNEYGAAGWGCAHYSCTLRTLSIGKLLQRAFATASNVRARFEGLDYLGAIVSGCRKPEAVTRAQSIEQDATRERHAFMLPR